MSKNEGTPIVTRSNSYGSTPAQQNVETGNGNGNGNNNNAPATPSQIFCLHGRSNNVEVEDGTEMEMSDERVYRQTTTTLMTTTTRTKMLTTKSSPCLEKVLLPGFVDDFSTIANFGRNFAGKQQQPQQQQQQQPKELKELKEQQLQQQQLRLRVIIKIYAWIAA
ncbi:hypothetical protein AWZ03_014368 [Drosophila navojoa]|uniref:Uncharacterized protein n=1 Tax=Drosophila navojoa TaxID=7232 RepID=A0A484ARX3_DRONA|nr:hypothetical protein AWZ03_014368 [Drosophila navojoa]